MTSAEALSASVALGAVNEKSRVNEVYDTEQLSDGIDASTDIDALCDIDMRLVAGDSVVPLLVSPCVAQLCVEEEIAGTTGVLHSTEIVVLIGGVILASVCDTQLRLNIFVALPLTETVRLCENVLEAVTSDDCDRVLQNADAVIVALREARNDSDDVALELRCRHAGAQSVFSVSVHKY